MCYFRESTVYLNCNPGVALEETTAVADGEVKGRLHYVSPELSNNVLYNNIAGK